MILEVFCDETIFPILVYEWDDWFNLFNDLYTKLSVFNIRSN